MAPFDKVPLVRGDTDDDASIHLHGRVGPSRPISYLKYDQQIREILNDSNSSRRRSDAEVRERDYNTRFEEYAQSSPFESGSDEELTQVESDSDLKRVSAPKNTTLKHKTFSVIPNSSNSSRKRTQKVSKRSAAPLRERSPEKEIDDTVESLSLLDFFWSMNMVAFTIGVVILVLLPYPLLMFGGSRISMGASEVQIRIDEVTQRIGALSDVAKALNQQVDLMVVKQDALIQSMNLRVSAMESVLQALRIDSVDEARVLRLENEVSKTKLRISQGLDLLSESPEQFEAKINHIAQELEQFQRLSSDVRAMKEEVISEVLGRLPDHIPIYIHDDQIRYTPEFYDFLVTLVGNYTASNNTLTWKQFMASYGTQFKSYIDELMGKSDVKFLTKAQFEESLRERLSSNNRALVAKLNGILDKLDLLNNVTSIDIASSGNRIVLENLLEVVGKGSMKVNFADYRLGARILGFLTTTGVDSYRKKSLARTVLLGWYDYLTSSGLSSAANMRYNANNVLVEGGQYWQCESRKCGVGVRLSSAIIVTDLIFNNPIIGKPEGLHSPEVVSVYVKPRKRTDAAKLEQHLEFRLGLSYQSSYNKFLAKFYKVQETTLRGAKSIQHIKLPTSIINMRISARDIYVEISSRAGTTGLYNMKVYGITEYNSFRYAENFESILDHLEDDKIESSSSDISNYFHEDSVLGDDYMV